MSQGKNIVTESFTSPVTFLLGTVAVYVLTWIFSLFFLAGRVEGGMEALIANPFDLRMTLLFISVYGCVIGIAAGILSARSKGKNFTGTATDGFLAGLAGVCGSWINWLWALMMTIWAVLMTLPVIFKAVTTMSWPGAKAFFVFFSAGPFNGQVLTYSSSFHVVWAGGLVMAIAFIYLFHNTLYEGFNPVFDKTLGLGMLGVVLATGILAIVVPQAGITLMCILLAGSVSAGPLVCIHDCLWSGNGSGVPVSDQTAEV